MTRSTSTTIATLRTWLLWTAGFVAFPIAGLAGTAVAGRVDDAIAGFIGGTVAGLVIGVGQVLASHGRLDARRWVPATALGMGAGLSLGAANAEYGTTIQALALMGFVTGIVLGGAQAWALPTRTRMRWLWAVAISGLWPLGWAVTMLGGIDVDRQHTIFGLSGALAFTALSGLVLERLLPDEETDDEMAPDVPAATSV